MITKEIIDGQSLLVECAAALKPAAGDVLRSIAELTRSGTPVRDGLRIRFGWSLLTLRAERNGLRVCEPRFAGDAENQLNRRLDTTLGVLVAQVRWLHRLSLEGCDVAFDQSIVVAGDALSAPDIFALRGKANAEADSGWSIAPVPAAGGQIDMTDLHAMPIYKLVATRPGVLPFLALPVGCLVRLKGNDVVEVSAPDGRVVWRSSALLGSPDDL